MDGNGCSHRKKMYIQVHTGQTPPFMDSKQNAAFQSHSSLFLKGRWRLDDYPRPCAASAQSHRRDRKKIRSNFCCRIAAFLTGQRVDWLGSARAAEHQSLQISLSRSFFFPPFYFFPTVSCRDARNWPDELNNENSLTFHTPLPNEVPTEH